MKKQKSKAYIFLLRNMESDFTHESFIACFIKKCTINMKINYIFPSFGTIYTKLLQSAQQKVVTRFNEYLMLLHAYFFNERAV